MNFNNFCTNPTILTFQPKFGQFFKFEKKWTILTLKPNFWEIDKKKTKFLTNLDLKKPKFRK